jgi:hypothetical protein
MSQYSFSWPAHPVLAHSFPQTQVILKRKRGDDPATPSPAALWHWRCFIFLATLPQPIARPPPPSDLGTCWVLFAGSKVCGALRHVVLGRSRARPVRLCASG